MKIGCQSMGQFLENLRKEEGNVFRNLIYVERTERSVQDCQYVIGLQASTIIEMGESGQYLLELGQDCGIDWRDASNELLGSQEAEDCAKELQAYCEGQGLEIRPGHVEI